MQAEREARLIADNEQGGQSAVKAAGYRAWLRDSWVAIKLNWVLFVRLLLFLGKMCSQTCPSLPLLTTSSTGLPSHFDDWFQLVQPWQPRLLPDFP